jgi:transcriptional regulator with XRE-family HTH domain
MSELPDLDTSEADSADQSYGVGGRSIENARLRKVVAERLIEARAICGLDQGGAAQRMGYINSTQICLWEQAKRLPPHNVLLRCADVYGVSLDYLLGRCDSPERDELLAGRNAVLRTAADIIGGCAEQLTEQLQRQLLRGTRSTAVARSLADRAANTTRALVRFRELNESCFDDLRGGASVLHAIRELEAATATARATFNAQPARALGERRHRV